VISPFVVPLKILLMAAFLIALPVVLYQVWAFVAPGLYSHEKKLVLPLVISSTLLFFVGVAFCYFFVFGQVFKFIQSFAPKSITAAPDIEAYLSFVLACSWPSGSPSRCRSRWSCWCAWGGHGRPAAPWRGYFWVAAAVGTAAGHAAGRGSHAAAGRGGWPVRGRHLAAQLFIKHTKAPAAGEHRSGRPTGRALAAHQLAAAGAAAAACCCLRPLARRDRHVDLSSRRCSLNGAWRCRA
jgi:sec-independent protein translocase protein TatC